MAYKGMKVEKEGFILEVTDVKSIGDNFSSVEYIVKRGSQELTEAFVIIRKGENSEMVLRRTLNRIVRAVKRIPSTK